MPELPEVEVVRQGLAPFVINQTITQVIVRYPLLRWPIPEQLPHILKDLTILDIQRRGKYLLFSTVKGILMIHLGMSGSLRLLKKHVAPKKHDHVDILFSNKMILRYTNPRRFGSILWTDQPIDQHPLLKNLGPEPLFAAFTGDYLFSRSLNRKIVVKSFLMDSKIVVGIGNIYANEALFQAGIAPMVAAGKISKPRYHDLAIACKDVLTRAIKAGGSTLNDFLNADGNPGHFVTQLWVYGREGKSCLKCQTLLEKIIINQRTTVYCKKCQI